MVLFFNLSAIINKFRKEFKKKEASAIELNNLAEDTQVDSTRQSSTNVESPAQKSEV